jgi:hypothetical protein
MLDSSEIWSARALPDQEDEASGPCPGGEHAERCVLELFAGDAFDRFEETTAFGIT